MGKCTHAKILILNIKFKYLKKEIFIFQIRLSNVKIFHCFYGDKMAGEPVNKMYGNKVKLDLSKLGNKSDEDSTAKVEEKTETVNDVETKVENVVEDKPQEVKAEGEPQEVVSEEIKAEDKPQEEVSEKTTEEKKEKPKKEPKPKNNDSKVAQLRKELKDKESKLKNQSNELNYLTNKVIPNLKKENSELKSVKRELTDALDKTSRKYYDQLDISAELSNRIGELGADSAVNKARTDRIESELDSIKENYEEKIKSLKDQIATLKATNVEELEETNQNLRAKLKTANDELEEAKNDNASLQSEVDDLRRKLIEMGDYKDEVDEKAKKDIGKLKDEIVSLRADLKIKQSNYDKLSNDSQRTISDLKTQVNKLKEDNEKQASKGLFDRFK